MSTVKIGGEHDDGSQMIIEADVPVPPDAILKLRGQIETAERAARRRLMSGHSRAAALTQGSAAALVLDLGRCTSVHVEHTDHPAVMTHEHGLLVFIPVDDGRTHMLDVCSVDGDPRWDLHEAGDLMRRHWRWIRLGEAGMHDFVASGPAIEPLDLGDLHGTTLEPLLTESDEGWPGDDVTLDVEFSTLVALAQ